MREVAVAGDNPWVAIRGGLLEKLDPECHTSLATADLATAIPPSPTSGTVADFVALKAGDETLWAIVQWLDTSGSPVAAHVVRVDAKTAKVTATTPLTQLDYSRTSNGLAVQGDSIWVADAVTAGTAAKIDPTTATVVAKVGTPAGAQSANQDIATDDEGRL